jgi:hypothetical protein
MQLVYSLAVVVIVIGIVTTEAICRMRTEVDFHSLNRHSDLEQKWNGLPRVCFAPCSTAAPRFVIVVRTRVAKHILLPSLRTRVIEIRCNMVH